MPCVTHVDAKENSYVYPHVRTNAERKRASMIGLGGGNTLSSETSSKEYIEREKNDVRAFTLMLLRFSSACIWQ